MAKEEKSYRLTADTVRPGIWYVVHRGNKYLHKGDAFCLSAPYYLEIDRLACGYLNQLRGLECLRLDGPSDTPTHVFAGVKGDIHRRHYSQLAVEQEKLIQEGRMKKIKYENLITDEQVLREPQS